jgi:hypothetical protein
MTYDELGYSKLFNRSGTRSLNWSDLPDLTSAEFEFLTQEVSGSKITGGKIVSNDGRLVIDLENNELSYSSGLAEVFSLRDGEVTS